jgi:hypothetical protein
VVGLVITIQVCLWAMLFCPFEGSWVHVSTWRRV